MQAPQWNIMLSFTFLMYLDKQLREYDASTAKTSLQDLNTKLLFVQILILLSQYHDNIKTQDFGIIYMNECLSLIKTATYNSSI